MFYKIINETEIIITMRRRSEMKVTYKIDIGGFIGKLIATYLISVALSQPFLYVLLVVILMFLTFEISWTKNL
jgi:hypothetical protein